MASPEIKIEIASVKVMRSYDHCHFEITLSSSCTAAPGDVDELRKTAARLADKAVEQYKIARLNAQNLLADKAEYEHESARVERLLAIPEAERTAEDKAEIKASQDHQWSLGRRYDYEDDWQDDQD